MYKLINLNVLDDVFKDINQRAEKGAYIVKSFNYSSDIENFLKKAVSERSKYNILITDKLNNPDKQQLDYYESMLGLNFEMNKSFINTAVKKWLPRLNIAQQELLSDSIYEVLEMLLKQGKTENILKNIYIKFMCWFYYRLESTLNKLGQAVFPKIIYVGEISNHELLLMRLLAESGCDVILFIPNKESYEKADKENILSYSLNITGGTSFPAGFNAGFILNLAAKQINNAGTGTANQINTANKVNITNPARQNTTNNANIKIPQEKPYMNTNTWLTGNVLDDILKEQSARGSDDFIYNVFAKIVGVWSKSTYKKDLYMWQKKLEEQGRKLISINKLDVPNPAETSKIPRNAVNSRQDIINNLYPAMYKVAIPKIDNIIYKAFYDIIMNDKEEKINRINNKAIYIVCWFNRIAKELYSSYARHSKTPVFVYFKGCTTQAENMFIKFLSDTPVDVLLLCPAGDEQCILEDNMLFLQTNTDYLDVQEIPKSADDTSMGTVAYHAEQELTNIMYQDSGMYRNMQYPHADSLKLQTMLEEINILWHHEGTFRPGFETVNNTVLLPVILAKINGVKNGHKKQYWENVRKKLGDDTLLIDRAPYIRQQIQSSLKPTELIKNGKLLRDKIKSSPAYRYGILRNDIQEHILDKIQLMLDRRIIKGTFSQGMEYRILNVVLNMDRNVLRLIQKFDFTKYIPKVVAISCNEQAFTVDDAILFAFLHFAGFDIVIYAPTGYQVIETHYSEPFFVDYQAGEYKYNMDVRDIEQSILGKLFGR